MRPSALVAAAGLGAAFLFSPAARPALAETPREPRNIAGRYRSTGDGTKSATLKALAPGVYQAVGDGWEGVGMTAGSTYLGVFVQGRLDGPGGRVTGTHRGTLRSGGSLAVHTEFDNGRQKSFEVVWVPEREPAPPAPPDPGRLPALGDYVYVEELPEALTKVAPVYPESAREAKLEGTVMAQALVGKDGRVADTRILRSIPGLDEAAVSAVRQWVFKPASSGGKPVAVWVAVPVRFPPP